MNHPTREEWISYLYEETTPGERAALSAHLHSCPDCAAKLSDWESNRKNLNGWPLPSRMSHSRAARSRAALRRTALKWAAAAAVVFGIGAGVGRLTSTSLDIAQVRAALEPEIRRQLESARAGWEREFAGSLRTELDRTASETLAASGEQVREWLDDFARTIEARRAEENRAVYAALQRMESQRVADFLSLKRDLDTVALNTDAGLRQTERQLIQLTGYAPPAEASNTGPIP